MKRAGERGYRQRKGLLDNEVWEKSTYINLRLEAEDGEGKRVGVSKLLT